jgi:hypothetical protein
MSAKAMPELLSVHGRCPRCSQVLTVPAGQLQSLFRCARCQYRLPGAALVDEARTSPPRPPAFKSPVLGPFDEEPDDQQTRMHLPGSGADEESERPLPAVLVEHAPSPVPSRVDLPLQRFDAGSDDADDQQTRLHVGGSFDTPAPPPARPATAGTRSSGMPPSLTRFDRASEDADDQATRLHLADTLEGPSAFGESRAFGSPVSYVGAAVPQGVVRDQTLMGVAPPAPFGAGLQRFEQASEEGDEQNTRLQVPISYDDSDGALRPPVAPRLTAAQPGGSDFAPGQPSGSAVLQLSRWIDDWLHEQRPVLLITLAALCAIIAPGFDALLGSTRHGATVIAANLVLFFVWTLAFAWLGKLRNDAGNWDYRVALTRFTTGVRLAAEDLAHWGVLPLQLRWRLVGEVFGVLGILGLVASSALTLSQLVWLWPTDTLALFMWRVGSAALVVLSVVALQQAVVPATLSGAAEVTAPAVAHFPAVLDLSLPLSVHPLHGVTPLHQVLQVLSEWPPREWPNQDSYAAVLERHFCRRMGWARVERDRWLSERRSDGIAQVIVNDSLLIEVMRGFDADGAERVADKMRTHARVWRGKPALIVVFDASRAALLNGAGTAALEALHQSYPMLTVRMPSARMSLA